ncbi:protein PF14_0175-like [Drosophila obscura]|uniref:protein PF14_0175-like n=1 Tax=Drosophila obscura TaxID=7282 RepID=UPI001BB26C38|nr:protein PF14_0175-like [Drosophila obscura]XP_041452285.1 protein PF14_0175-like [Drosophila obscura]XP_041452286.1 protein PF14_0175-like [Drosophila obscura]
MPHMEISNYTKAHTISIHKGIGRLQTSSIKLIHIIDLKQIETELLTIRDHTMTDLKKSYLYHTLTHEMVQALSALSTLYFKDRKTRSINWIGSAWKYVAGSPDHDDLMLIHNNLNNLITNNNDQVIINSQLQDRINNLTFVSNMLKNSIRDDNGFSNEIAISLQNQVRLLKEEIINVKYAIQWARLNVINSLLLNENELQEVHNIFQKNNMSSLTVEEMLELTDISVLHNKTTIIYIVKIPELDSTNFENLIIKPVIKNNLIVNIEANEIFLSDNDILKIPNNCKTTKEFKICYKKKTVNLQHTNCIAKLVRGKESLCGFTNADHIQTIEEIDNSLLLLNNFNGSIRQGNKTHQLRGTYLLHFWNDSIIIDKKEFNNKEKTILKPGVPLIQMTPTEMERLQILSLESLQALNVKNTKHLNLIKTHSTNNSIAIFCLLGTIITSIFITRCVMKPKDNIIIQETLQIPNNNIKLNNIKPIQLEFNNIPYF